MSRTLPTTRVRPVATSTDNPVRRSRTILSRTISTSNSSVQGHRLVQFDNRLFYCSFRHSCLRRCRTSRGALHRTVRSRTEKTDAMTFVSRLDLQTSTWFDYSAENSSQTVGDLAYPAVLFSSTFRRRLSSEFNNVELHRPTVRGPAQTNSFNVSVSTMSNSIDSHRLPFMFPSSTMSNSIDQLYVKSSIVEFHQHPTKAVCPSPCQQCRTPSTVQADPSCVQS